MKTTGLFAKTLNSLTELPLGYSKANAMRALTSAEARPQSGGVLSSSDLLFMHGGSLCPEMSERSAANQRFHHDESDKPRIALLGNNAILTRSL